MVKRTDRLESKVMRINHNMTPKGRKGERYVPWCNFLEHFGIITDEYVCKKRYCKHYYRLYINEDSQYFNQEK